MMAATRFPPIVLASDTTLTVANAADTLTLSGNVSGTGGLTLEGSGALLLSGDNSYDGGTTVNSGTLYVTNSAALPAGTSLLVGRAERSSSIPRRLPRRCVIGRFRDNARARARHAGTSDSALPQ